MNVLVLSDGVAGHDRSSEGVVAALTRLRPVKAQWLGIREIKPRSRRLARLSASIIDPGDFLSRRVRLAPERVAPRVHPACDTWPDSADVVVSTGPSTAAGNIAAARWLGAKSLYCGFPKWPVTGFTLVLSPVASGMHRVVFTPRPTTIDGAVLPAPRPLADDAPRTLALLFGGETKHYTYTNADMDRLSARLSAILEARAAWSLLVYDSRRTTAARFDRLTEPLSRFGHRVSIHRFGTHGVASNADAFRADIVIVTADSLSMATEAIASGRPTIVAAAGDYRGPRRDRAEFAALAGAGHIRRARFGDLDPALLDATPRPPQLSRPRALADLLSDRGF